MVEMIGQFCFTYTPLDEFACSLTFVGFLIFCSLPWVIFCYMAQRSPVMSVSLFVHLATVKSMTNHFREVY
jgi:hypothetical protein